MTSCRISRWRISAILDFMGPIMGSLKSPCTTRSSIQTIALNCLVFEKIAFLHFGDRQTDQQRDQQMDSSVAWSRSRCRGRWLNNSNKQITIDMSNELTDWRAHRGCKPLLKLTVSCTWLTVGSTLVTTRYLVYLTGAILWVHTRITTHILLMLYFAMLS